MCLLVAVKVSPFHLVSLLLLLESRGWLSWREGAKREGSDDGHAKGLEPPPIAWAPRPSDCGHSRQRAREGPGWLWVVRLSLAQICPDRSMGSRQLAKVHHWVGETYEQMNTIGFYERGEPDIAQKTLCLALSRVGWAPDQLTKKETHQPHSGVLSFFAALAPSTVPGRTYISGVEQMKAMWYDRWNYKFKIRKLTESSLAIAIYLCPH